MKQFKRIISLVLSCVVAFGIFVIPSYAAAGDHVINIALTDTTLEGVPVVEVDMTLTNSTRIKAVIATISYDTSVLKLVDLYGAELTLPHTSDVINYLVNGEDSEDFGYIANEASFTLVNRMDAGICGTRGIVGIQGINSAANKKFTTPTSFGKFYLAYQDGKSKADVKEDTIVFATYDEAYSTVAGTASAKVVEGSADYAFGTEGGAKDNATFMANCTITPTNFEFGTDKPAVTTVEAPAADATAFVYNGTAQTYAIAANDAYTVTGATQTNAGTYTVTVALNDTTAYVWADGTTDAKTYNFVIAPKSIAGAVVADVADVVYTGSAFEPTPAVTVDGVALVAGADFDYAYENNTAIGTATVKVVAKGNYTGEASTTFVIADDYTAMKYAAGYSYKIENGTLYVKGADATIYVIEAKYEGAKMTSCVLKPVVITGGVANVAVDTTATLFIWDANMQAMN